MADLWYLYTIASTCTLSTVLVRYLNQVIYKANIYFLMLYTYIYIKILNICLIFFLPQFIYLSHNLRVPVSHENVRVMELEVPEDSLPVLLSIRREQLLPYMYIHYCHDLNVPPAVYRVWRSTTPSNVPHVIHTLPLRAYAVVDITTAGIIPMFAI